MRRFLAILGASLVFSLPQAGWAKATKDKAKAKHSQEVKHAPPPKKPVAVQKSAGPDVQALQLADQDKWPQARQMAESSGNKLAFKLIRWLDAARPNSGATFREITTLLGECPDWPNRSLVMRRAEEAITLTTPADQILSWFDVNKPVSADGGMAYGGALLAAGRTEEGQKLLRETWVNKDFGVLQERAFLAKYRELLTNEDHLARMKRLIWEDQREAAQRLVLFLDGEGRELAHARLMLAGGHGTPAHAFESVPEKLRNDPGLMFDAVRWYRRKEMYEEAIRLARQAPDDLERPDLWWTERSFLARRALLMGYVSEAYEIASKHHQNDGANAAEAEWLSGWIALRFLLDKEAALKHFQAMNDKALTAHGKARAAYWTGRAYEALGKKDEAKAQYRQAALFASTYYGQLASEQMGPEHGWLLPTDPVPSEDERKAFAQNDLAKAVDLMAEAGTAQLARPFLLKLLDNAETPGQKALAVAKSERLGRIDLAVYLARRADRAGVTLPSPGWPVPPYGLPESGPEKALILALIRQESGFHAEAVSSVGARGLMQLMPATAKTVAKSMNIKYQPANLTKDPSLNIRLGTSYLQGLLGDFKGSYIMALAGYNAGPHRVVRWIREFGDPREADTDPIDWVEQIPFSETRGYVQRVMESVQIYRKRLGKETSTVALITDLKRRQD
jgi:soluble lytic murein transglycosylase